ncbi:hypothetical protein H632_c2569p1 [Helicosporidium sp. ATCC 50920]|nr:hypothetical protein H632_c2569p1 [Helicosporidium sp. ATCC 50920]|eukprot:KDD73069.1 hypothetical protein H632_c2569p1 [Helicosporidium sp. ATCC 50920]
MSLASAFDASASNAAREKGAEDDWGWGEDEGWGETASAQPPAPEPPSQAPQSTGDPDLVEMGFDLDPLRVREIVSDAAPSLSKLKELLELLDIRLVVIRERWEEGRLAALGFAPQEVAHLVRALFEDTEMREDFLHLLDRER